MPAAHTVLFEIFSSSYFTHVTQQLMFINEKMNKLDILFSGIKGINILYNFI